MTIDPNLSGNRQLDELLSHWRQEAPPVDLAGLEGRLQVLWGSEALGSTVGTPLLGAQAAARGAGMSRWGLAGAGTAVAGVALLAWLVTGRSVESSAPSAAAPAAAQLGQPLLHDGQGAAALASVPASVPSLSWDELPEVVRPVDPSRLRLAAGSATGTQDGGGVGVPVDGTRVAGSSAAGTLVPEREAPEVSERLELVSPAVAPAIVDRAAMDPGEELRQLMQIRRVLSVDPARGLQLADEGNRAFARGTLGEEREALAITALAQLGRRPEARARAARFLDRYPRSGFSGKMRAVLQQ